MQMLDPSGVGVRSLSECLTLQLAQSSTFALTLAIARDGLELLGKRDYIGLAALLGVSLGEAKQVAAKALTLNPIPSCSFASGEPVTYIAPDAIFSVEQGKLVIKLNEHILPRLSVNAEYSVMLSGSTDGEA